MQSTCIDHDQTPRPFYGTLGLNGLKHSFPYTFATTVAFLLTEMFNVLLKFKIKITVDI